MTKLPNESAGASSDPATPTLAKTLQHNAAVARSASSPSLTLGLPSIPDHEVLHPIDSGAYGEVWLARNAVGTLRAVKIVRRDRHVSAESFEREFKGLQKFEPVSRSHDGVVDILTLGLLPDGAGFYYVMELADTAPAASNQCSVISNQSSVPGTAPARLKTGHCSLITDYSPRTLRADLKTRGELRADEVIALGLKLTSALAHLHAQGLVHRDVKPSNILFIGGEPKLADAGLVAELDDARSMVGTAGYIAPEGPGTPQADLYALGKVLYEAAFRKDRQEFPALPADVASRPDHARLLELNAILLKACASGPRERYRSAEQMRGDLNLLATGHSVKSRQVWRQTLKQAKRFALAAGGLGIATAILFSVLARRMHPPDFPWSKNQEANEEYQRGLRAFHQNTPELTAQAATNFQRAIDLDPGFARAHARLALTYISMGFRNPQMLAKARPIAERALALDPESDEAHRAIGVIKSLLLREWTGAEAEYKKAIKLNPNSAENVAEYAYFLSNRGWTNEAVRQIKKALRLDSRSYAMVQGAAFVFQAARQPDEVIKNINELVARAPSASVQAALITRFLVPAYRAKGDYLTAIRLEEESEMLNGKKPDEVKAKYSLLRKAFAQAQDKEKGYWRQRLQFELSENGENRPTTLAAIYARLDETQTAIQYLQRALEKTPTELVFELNRDPSFDSLRSDSRFSEILKALGK